MLERFGPYFAYSGAHTAEVSGGDWSSLADALRPDRLEAAVERLRAEIAQRGPVSRSRADLRAVASTLSLGLCARLISPHIGAALTGEPAPEPDPDTLWLGEVESGPVRLQTSAPLVEADPDAAVDGLILPVLDALGSQFHVPRLMLLGNAAAAVIGACHVVALIEPDLGPRCDAARARMLSQGPLRGAGTPSGEFVRVSCCQIYRLPMDYMCTNCILVHRQTGLARGFAAGRREHRLRSTIDFERAPFR